MSITEKELTLLRAEQEKFMGSRVDVRGPTYLAEDEVKDADIYTDQPARIKSGFGFFREIADRMQGITAYTITMRWNLDVRVGHKIVDRNTGEVFEVRDVRDKNTYQTALQVLGDRIK